MFEEEVANTFEYMTENAVDGSGLCDYCDRIPFSSHPTLGGVFCEGMGCRKAYNLYLNDFHYRRSQERYNGHE